MHFNIFANKKNFFGLVFKERHYNFSGKLDLLEIKLKTSFPFYNFENDVSQGLKKKYFDKNTLKISYQRLLVPLKKTIQVQAVKG